MRCLLVEDEAGRIDAILPELEKYFGEGNVVVAMDRDSAKENIDKQPYDLIVLDQSIPTGAERLNPNVMHGRSVLSYVLEVAPDTPVYFLTGLPMEDEYIDSLIAEGKKCDVWGDRKPISLILRFQKSSPQLLLDAVSKLTETARTTHEIEINTKGKNIQLSDEEKRLMRSFSRLQNGVCVDIELLGDGLSGALVLKADVKDKRGAVRISAASKIGKHKTISDEIGRYERELVRLRPGTHAPIVAGAIARVATSMGAFYRLLDGYEFSLFKVLERSDKDAATCVSTVRQNQNPWTESSTVARMRVDDLVKLVIWEENLPKIHALIDDLNWQAFENREISVNMCTRHGDLHGENVLINSDLAAMMIDYGAVGAFPSAFDAITLELSPFFHPHGLRGKLNWTPEFGAIDWYDREAFCEITTMPNYIAACRDWAHHDGFGDREVLACAYAYVLRQLQFPTTDKDLARAIISGILVRNIS